MMLTLFMPVICLTPGRVLRSASVNVGEVWMAVFLAYFVLVNVGHVLAGYAILLLYGALAVVAEIQDPPGLTLLDCLALPFIGILPHIFLIPVFATGSVSLLAIIFTVISAITEEIFFRGFLMKRLGLPIQALVFMYSHLSVTDPLFLVNSSLLAPHYFVFGLTAGLIADRKGFEGSSLFHATYNLAATLYFLALNTTTISLLLASDIFSLAAVLVYLRFSQHKILFSRV
ncbi:MAG: hypothetical protein B7L53_03670 [Thermofilum sp. NZ13]|nr:MAG: hypothetical protein B7L53_03670 [Thermofilum sp. NZ13]